MIYDNFRAMVNKAYSQDMDLEIMWKVVQHSKNFHEFETNMALMLDRDIEEGDE